MSLTEKQQFIELFSHSNRPLIALPENPSPDDVAGACALASIAARKGKPVDIIAIGYRPSDRLSFLPFLSHIHTTADNLRQFCITVNTERVQVTNIQWREGEGTFTIYLTPQGGFWQPEDVHIKRSGWIHDLCIVLDSKDLESLGPLFDHHAEFFHHTPIVNIDHHPENEHFGQVNIVNIKATSLCEVLYEVIQEWDPDALGRELATCLLTGIIAKTQSFRRATTPHTLSLSAELIQKGADRSTIVQYLYQQKSLSTLKLWGRVLARMQYDESTKLVWSILPFSDFKKSHGNPAELPSLIDELIANSPQAGTVAIVWEDDRGIVHARVRLLANHHNLLEVLEMFQPKGTREEVELELPQDIAIAQAQDTIITPLQRYLAGQGHSAQP